MPFREEVLEPGRLYTRPQLAELWGYESFHAISRGVVTPRESDVIILFVTREKQASLTQYQDFLNGDRLHWEGEKRHGSDDRIARAHENGEAIHLFYRDVHHTPFRYHGQVLLTRFTRRKTEPSNFVFQLVHDLSPADDIAVHEPELEAVPETEREAIVKARVGQGDFRESLLIVWKGCAITGIDRADLLRASHIKPWRYSTNAERLDRFNGLLLLPQYDHMFDRGYITFDDRGVLEPSPAIASLPADRLGIDLFAKMSRVEDEHLPFLEYHREEVFVAKRQ
jgi:putative restriction endonuclease